MGGMDTVWDEFAADNIENYRALVRAAPGQLPDKVKVRIRFVNSIACKREYERWRAKVMKYCAETGFCPPMRLYKPYRCIMFRAEAVTGDMFVPIGYLLLITDSKWRGFIYDVYVARPWRNIGIGTALVKAAVMLVRAKKGTKIKAFVLDRDAAVQLMAYGAEYNPAACKRILEKNGFVERELGYYELDVRKLGEPRQADESQESEDTV